MSELTRRIIADGDIVWMKEEKVDLAIVPGSDRSNIKITTNFYNVDICNQHQLFKEVSLIVLHYVQKKVKTLKVSACLRYLVVVTVKIYVQGKVFITCIEWTHLHYPSM